MADWLKTKYPALKVLFTSGYTDEVIAHHGALDPRIAFLAKPCSIVELARKVRELLDTPSNAETNCATQVGFDSRTLDT